ncbi:autotransporter outer membrane beta-barrel domain-containing protein [Scandinavium sp. H11S7]|uniref:autotransporter outer membrane beta-barrel domain-containing protein n=1 Tax=Scandinavium hiltneri TaxID=2926519 RepID=UPI0021666B6B|nr:autotransporter outer membrane beta-barrel domain-containing protein [Scandinavium hiltneri]MCS2158152.1 autotransporter outer membrane beta-barrel domain-containing protein [Scandinavium hiltneri]
MRDKRRYNFRVSRLSLVLAIGYGGMGQALAACSFGSGPGYDVVVVCDNTLPNPYTVPVQFSAPTTASVLIQPDAQLLITGGGNGVLVSGNSTIINNGSVTLNISDDLFFDALSSRGALNALTNNGTLTTTGLRSEGIYTNGSDTTILNTGTIITHSNLSDGIISDQGSTASLITNQGSITTQGDNSSGIEVLGDNHQVFNTGSINTTGTDSYGLKVDGNKGLLNNRGTITTQGSQAYGLEGLGSQHQLVNDGTIEIHGENAAGMFAYGEQSLLTNNEQILTEGIASHGMLANGDGLQIVNNGTIRVTGDYADGIRSIGSDTQTLGVIVNNGTVQALGNNGDGIFVSSPTTVTNSATGTINSAAGQGVNFVAGGNVNNSGSITSDNATGIQLNGNADITNTATGVIQGSNAIFNNGGITTIDNQGTLIGTGGAAINLPGAFNTTITTRGTIQGSGAQAIVTGAGDDAIIITGGVITGNIVQNGGSDSVTFLGGTQHGTVMQGDGIDTFTLHGGTTSSVQQGDGRDIFTMTGGEVGGEIRMGNGNDTLLWQDAGLIHGAILMGNDNDQATLKNLTTESTSSPPVIDAGTGNDRLTLDNTVLSDPARLTQWEAISLINQSQLQMSSSLTLGDNLSQTGTLAINNSRILAGNRGAVTIQAYDAASPVSVTNAGVIDLTDGGNSTADTLTIAGNYTGQRGQLKLQTELNDETSPSDRLIISGGNASGATQIQVFNVNGSGAYTAGNGIELISAINGGTTEGSAFSLNGGSISAGAYEYVLFRGGVTAGSENNWYLRNSLIAPPTTPSEPSKPSEPSGPSQPSEPSVQVPVPQPASGSPVLPVVRPGSPVIPLYRQETPLYSVLPPLVMELGLTQLGTYHDRQGNQTVFADEPALNSWGRIWGISSRHSWSGDTGSSFDGDTTGVQVGQDVYHYQQDNGSLHRLGLFYGYTHIHGDVDGSVLGFSGARAGDVKLTGNSLGGYWTWVGQDEAYLDTVLMYTWLDGSTHSLRNIDSDYSGRLLSGSMEAGIPFSLTAHWHIEPQAQMIVQHLRADNSEDSVSAIRYQDETVYTGRIGARLAGDYALSSGTLQPYLKVNLWHDFQHTGQVALGADPINMGYESTTLDVGGGVVATLHNGAKLYAVLSQNRNLDGEHVEEYSGNLGVKINW